MKRMLVLGMLGALLWVSSVQAATFTWLKGAQDTWVSNNTNVTSGARILSAAITITNTNYTKADCELNVPSWSTTVTANTAVVVWILGRSDGTNYEDGDASNDPARPPDIVFPLRNVSTAQRIQIRGIDLPRDLFKALVKNEGTGATMQGATTLWTLKCTPYILQSP